MAELGGTLYRARGEPKRFSRLAASALLVGIVGTSSGFSSSALADDVTTRPLAQAVTVEASRCLDGDRLASSVEKWLGRSVIDQRIAISVARRGDVVVYGLHKNGVLVGERTVTNLPAGCTEFETALALSIAVAIESTFFNAKATEEPPESAPPPAPTEDAPGSASAPRPRRLPHRKAPPPPVVGHPRASVAVEAGVLGKTLPGVRPIGMAGLDVAWSSSLSTRTSLLATTAATSTLGTGQVETQLFAARGDVCATHLVGHVGRVDLRGCAGIAWGIASAHGSGFLEDHASSQPWLAMPLRGEVRVALGRDTAGVGWGVLFSADLWLTLRRAQVGVLGQGSDARTAVLTLPVLGGGATAGFFFDL